MASDEVRLCLPFMTAIHFWCRNKTAASDIEERERGVASADDLTRAYEYAIRVAEDRRRFSKI